jgi:hypothetical protein
MFTRDASDQREHECHEVVLGPCQVRPGEWRDRHSEDHCCRHVDSHAFVARLERVAEADHEVDAETGVEENCHHLVELKVEQVRIGQEDECLLFCHVGPERPDEDLKELDLPRIAQEVGRADVPDQLVRHCHDAGDAQEEHEPAGMLL